MSVTGLNDQRAAGLSYKRILLKLSGEVLKGDEQFGINHAVLQRVVSDIKPVVELGAEVCIVIGAGNILRGATLSETGIERCTADYMGMLATVINAMALHNCFEQNGVECRVLSGLPLSGVCEPYVRRRSLRHLSKGRVVIFAGGTGNPYFTTDTAAALRASEMDCDAILKGTNVDGVYSADPQKNPDAKKLGQISYLDVIAKDLRIMDTAAISLARENQIPIIVFNIAKPGTLLEVLKGQGSYSIVTDKKETEVVS